MKKIRIGYLISHLENGGPVNILYGIIKYLDKDKFEPYIITLKPEKKNTREKEFQDMGVVILKALTSNFDIVFKRNELLESKIKELKIEILHSQCLPSVILLANLKLKGVKKLNTLHWDFSTDLIYKFGKVRGYIFKKIYINALKRIDLNISCGRSVSKLNQIHSGIESISIMNGVDTEKINLENIDENKEQIQKKLRLPSGKKVFITVGSIDQRKNVLFLVEAFTKKLKNHILVIIGDGNKKGELEVLLKNSKNIYYYGGKRLEEIQYYLKGSDFYISASQSEGMPNSVLEALQFELPLILSDIEPHKEIIMLGDVGVTFRNNDMDDLKNKIEKIIKNTSSNLKIKEIKNKISARRMSKEYMLIYGWKRMGIVRK